MNAQRLNVIREVLAGSPVANQDELRRKLRRRGIHVTQATLSRDIHQLRLFKGPRRLLAAQRTRFDRNCGRRRRRSTANSR